MRLRLQLFQALVLGFLLLLQFALLLLMLAFQLLHLLLMLLFDLLLSGGIGLLFLEELRLPLLFVFEPLVLLILHFVKIDILLFMTLFHLLRNRVGGGRLGGRLRLERFPDGGTRGDLWPGGRGESCVRLHCLLRRRARYLAHLRDG